MINLRYTHILVAGLVARLAIAPFIAHPFDMYSWYLIENEAWTNGINVGHLLATLRPMWVWIISALAYPYYWLASALGVTPILVSSLPASMNPQYGIQIIPGPLFNLVTKLPLILSDLLLATVIYRLALSLTRNVGAANSAMALFFLNPAVIWISSAWGQFDTLPALFAVTSLYLILRGRILLSSISAILGVAAAPYALAIAIPIMTCILKKRTRKSAVVFALPIVAPLLLLFAMWPNSVWGYAMSLLSPSLFYNQIGFGLTYWSVSFLLPNGIGGSVVVFSVLLASLFAVAAYAILRFSYDDAGRDISAGAVLIALAFFLSYPIIAEQRFVWLAAFLPLLVGMGAWGKGRYLGLSLLVVLYAQKNFPFYLLPLTAVNEKLIQPLFAAASAFASSKGGLLLPNTLGGAVLATLGVCFSVVAASLYIELATGRQFLGSRLPIRIRGREDRQFTIVKDCSALAFGDHDPI